MKRSNSHSLVYLTIILSLILSACASNSVLVDRDVRYIKSRINTANKQSIVLQDGTIWGFNNFSVNTPGNEVIVTYDQLSPVSTAFINGIAKSVSFLGTTYDRSNNFNDINDIIHFNEGRLSFVTQIDSNGKYFSLSDNTTWVVRPDQRSEVKKWHRNETVILDNGKQFIVDPRRYKMIAVHQVNNNKGNGI